MLSKLSPKLKIPIATMNKLSNNTLSRPSIYKIIKTNPVYLKRILHVQNVMCKEFELIFLEYKKETYSRSFKNFKK